MSVSPILVTDHDPVYLELMRYLLEEEGYAPVVCVDQSDAWPTILRAPPRLVMLDVHLLDPDAGWSLLEKLRLHELTMHIPAIVWALESEGIDHSDARMERLAYRFLHKPFPIDDLLALIQKLIGPPSEGAHSA